MRVTVGAVVSGARTCGKAPDVVRCQCIAGQVLGPGGNRGGIDGVGCEIACRRKDRRHARRRSPCLKQALPRAVKVKVAVVIVKGSIASLKVAVIFVLIATPVAALAGIGGTHRGCGGVRGRTCGKAPHIVTCQCIAGQVLGPGGNRGGIGGVGCEIACRCKDRSDAGVGHRA